MITTTIIILLAIIATIIHLWKSRPFSNGICIAITICLLLCSWPGPIIYWVIFLVKKLRKNPVVQIEKTIPEPSDVVTGNEDAVTAGPVAEDCNEQDVEDDCLHMRTLFNQAMSGVNGAALSKAYSQMMQLFIIKANGDCKGAGLSGLMFADDRAKKIAKIDDSVVLPALGHDKELYESWWMTFYEDVEQTINESANNNVRTYKNAIIADVELGDEVLTKAGIFDVINNPEQYVGYDEKSTYYEKVILTTPNGNKYETDMAVKILEEGKKITVDTSEHRIRIKAKTKGDNVRYQICGAYQYFPNGLSLDPMVKYSEMLIAAVTLHILDKKKIDNAEMERFSLPSLSKLN